MRRCGDGDVGPAGEVVCADEVSAARIELAGRSNAACSDRAGRVNQLACGVARYARSHHPTPSSTSVAIVAFVPRSTLPRRKRRASWWCRRGRFRGGHLATLMALLVRHKRGASTAASRQRCGTDPAGQADRERIWSVVIGPTIRCFGNYPLVTPVWMLYLAARARPAT